MNHSYLRDILSAIIRIETYTIDGRAAFMANPMIQDAVVRNFEIIGEAVKRVPKSLLSKQPQIPWHDVAGFRDILIHDYYDVDLDEVWFTVERDLPALRQAVEMLLLATGE